MTDAVDFNNIGFCRYCGQIATFDINTTLNEEERNERITRTCNCKEAKQYNEQCNYEESLIKAREEELKRAKRKIEDLFGERSLEYGLAPENDDIKEILYTLIVLLVDNKIESSAMKISSKVNVKISKTAKGRVQIIRVDSVASKLEV